MILVFFLFEQNESFPSKITPNVGQFFIWASNIFRCTSKKTLSQTHPVYIITYKAFVSKLEAGANASLDRGSRSTVLAESVLFRTKGDRRGGGGEGRLEIGLMSGTDTLANFGPTITISCHCSTIVLYLYRYVLLLRGPGCVARAPLPHRDIRSCRSRYIFSQTHSVGRGLQRAA